MQPRGRHGKGCDSNVLVYWPLINIGDGTEAVGTLMMDYSAIDDDASK